MAAIYMDAHSADYSNDKHRQQWGSTLEAYVYPIIGSVPISEVKMQHVLQVLLQDVSDSKGSLTKFWYSKPETAKRVLGRMRAILDAATVAGYREGTNPATWTGYLDTQLPSPKKIRTVKHHPAIPYEQIGSFMVALRQKESVSAKALELLILTAVRSGSVRLATWNEIDFEKAIWVIPKEHNKIRQELRVPLQPQALNLLKKMPRFDWDSNVIFPGPTGKPLSDMALSQLMRGMQKNGGLGITAVPHGFRSTFRTWAAEQTAYPDEIRKAASGHAIGDKVKSAYQRTDLLEKRRELMIDWANFLDQPILNS
jgi:integrase